MSMPPWPPRKKPLKTWRHTTVYERSAILNKIADVIEAHAEELALQETLDNGKPIRETCAADIPLGAEHFRYFAGVVLAEEGSVNEIYNEDISIVLREPIGVVGQIIPWNFPFLMAAWKIAPAGRRLHRRDSPLIQHLAEPAFHSPKKSTICCQKACSM